MCDFRVVGRLSDLIELAGHFGCWRNENGRKVPYSPVTGRRVSTTRPKDWVDYDVAAKAVEMGPELYTGLAFVFFKEDGIVGIDLDNCFADNGKPRPWASKLLYRLADTYSEISPSGKGIKIWARGELPANLPGIAITGGGSIEMYGWARYFTVTGRVFGGAPLSIEDHTSDILALYKSLTSGKDAKTWPLQPRQNGKIPFGQIHNVLVSLCGTLRARKVCSEAIEACLVKVAEHQAEKPVTLEHIKQIIRSTQSWAAK